MKNAARRIKTVILAVLALTVIGFSVQGWAADMPLALASPLTGVAFEDRPLLLPVQRNFQMAMLTASSELGRSCGRMEAYGWRMGQTEQARVNQVFNNTVDRLRLAGYKVTPQSLSSVSSDITLLTADKTNKHFIFLWSAGDLGLVMSLCETSAPLVSTPHTAPLTPSVQVFSVPMDVLPASLDAVKKRPASAYGEGFSPLGKWEGGYSCAQGYTGGTLQIDHIRGKDIDGVFKFYPTSKNSQVPEGSYKIYGQYDRETNRILINPGEWIRRPEHFYNTVMVGDFDPTKNSFSAYFQGISGCTSFEATRANDEFVQEYAAKKKPAAHGIVKKKKKPLKKPAPLKPLVQTTPTPPPIVPPEVVVPESIRVGTPAAVSAAPTPVPATDPVSVTTSPAVPVGGVAIPAPKTNQVTAPPSVGAGK